MSRQHFGLLAGQCLAAGLGGGGGGLGAASFGGGGGGGFGAAAIAGLGGGGAAAGLGGGGGGVARLASGFGADGGGMGLVAPLASGLVTLGSGFTSGFASVVCGFGSGFAGVCDVGAVDKRLSCSAVFGRVCVAVGFPGVVGFVVVVVGVALPPSTFDFSSRVFGLAASVGDVSLVLVFTPLAFGFVVAVGDVTFAFSFTPLALGAVAVGLTVLVRGSSLPALLPGKAWSDWIVGAVVAGVNLAGVTTILPAFAAGLLTKACWLGRNCCVGFFWIACACVRTTLGTGVVAPTGFVLAAAAAAEATLPAATCGGGTLMTLLMTVVLWMLLKITLLGGGAT